MKRVKVDRLGIQRIDLDCARRADLTIEILFQGKWKPQILCAMRSGPIPLGQLARIVPGASKKIRVGRAYEKRCLCPSGSLQRFRSTVKPEVISQRPRQ